MFTAARLVPGSLASLGQGAWPPGHWVVETGAPVRWSTPPCPRRKGRPPQTQSSFVARAHSYKTSFGLIPSYAWLAGRGGEGPEEGRLQRWSPESRGGGPCRSLSRTPPQSWEANTKIKTRPQTQNPSLEYTFLPPSPRKVIIFFNRCICCITQVTMEIK